MTSRSAGATLPDASSLPDGHTIIVDGTISVTRGGVWVPISSSGITWFTDWADEAHPAGSIVPYVGGMYLATTDHPSGSEPPGSLMPTQYASQFSDMISGVTNVSQKIRVDSIRAIAAISLQRSMVGTFSGTVGISSTDPAIGVTWMVSKVVTDQVEDSGRERWYSFDTTGPELTEETSAVLVADTDYWIVVEGLATGVVWANAGVTYPSPGLTVSDVRTGTGPGVFSSADSHLGFWFRTRYSTRAERPASLGWALLVPEPSYVPAEPKGQITSSTGKRWAIDVSDAGVVSAVTVAPPANSSVSTAMAMAVGGTWSGDVWGAVPDPSILDYTGGVLWFMITPADDREVSVTTHYSTYDTVIQVYQSAIANPTTLADLTLVVERDSGDLTPSDFDTSYAVFQPRSRWQYWIAVVGYDVDARGYMNLQVYNEI